MLSVPKLDPTLRVVSIESREIGEEVPVGMGGDALLLTSRTSILAMISTAGFISLI